MIGASDIKKMTLIERLQAMELLWKSFSSDQLESPEWHGEVLSKRLSKVEEGKGTFLTVSEVKRRLHRP